MLMLFFASMTFSASFPSASSATVFPRGSRLVFRAFTQSFWECILGDVSLKESLNVGKVADVLV